MIPLSTQRLRLRPFHGDDVGFIRRLHAHPDLARFIPSVLTPDDEAARERLRRFTTLAEHPVQGFSVVELRQTEEPVGMVLVKPVPPSGGGEPQVLEIGWRQVAEHCGHGYSTEAARAVLDAVHTRGVAELVAVTHPDNTASQRVAERIGMERVGLSRDFYDTEVVLFRSRRERPEPTRWLPERWELLAEGTYGFAGPQRDRLVTALLSGAKRTTSSLLAEHERPPEPGGTEVVVDSSGAPVCITRDAGVEVVRLADVTEEHVRGEGEGFATPEQWRAAHRRFWTSRPYQEGFRASGAEPPVISDDTLVVCVRLEVLAQRPGVLTD